MEPTIEDTTMPDTTTTLPATKAPTTSKKSKKRPRRPSQSHEITSLTLPQPLYSYIYLTLLTSSLSITNTNTNQQAPDILTLRTYLTRALTQFLGLHGSAIPIDILKTGNGKEGREIWIRVPREDCSAVVAALGGWSMVVSGSGTGEEVGWRVRGWGAWLGGVVGREEVLELWGD